MGRTIRVLIIAPHDLSCNGLVALLNRPESNIRLVGAYRDLEEGETALKQLDPQVLLLDDALPASADIREVLNQLHRKFHRLNIMILSGRLQARYLQTLFDAGATGFIFREDRLEESLIVGIETVHHGFFYTSPRASGLLIANRASYFYLQLNQSDLEVLRLIDQGLTMKEIAADMRLSLRSVYRIRIKLRTALGAPTHEHLVAAAREKGLLTRDGHLVDKPT